jgi:hypothetical protein
LRMANSSITTAANNINIKTDITANLTSILFI